MARHDLFVALAAMTGLLTLAVGKARSLWGFLRETMEFLRTRFDREAIGEFGEKAPRGIA